MILRKSSAFYAQRNNFDSIKIIFFYHRITLVSPNIIHFQDQTITNFTHLHNKLWLNFVYKQLLNK